ncbi:hypothetical protein FACS1894187_10530 [Synergistales bacterium]|nr:hypothetical protein FACS1894187_10530 [Synergistales bacterium]
MFTVTINGNTVAELYSNIEALLSAKPSVPTQGRQPEPTPTAAPVMAPVAQFPANPTLTASTDPQAATTVPSVPTASVQSVPAASATLPTTEAPSSGVPIAVAPTYTLDQLARAGAGLAQAGKMQEALALLAKYGVQTVNQLRPEQYGSFATELRTLGAQV